MLYSTGLNTVKVTQKKNTFKHATIIIRLDAFHLKQLKMSLLPLFASIFLDCLMVFLLVSEQLIQTVPFYLFAS